MPNGGVRDLPCYRVLGFRMFVAGFVVSHVGHHVVAAGGSVEASRVRTEPGNLLYAGESGVIVIGVEIADRAAESLKPSSPGRRN